MVICTAEGKRIVQSLAGLIPFCGMVCAMKTSALPSAAAVNAHCAGCGQKTCEKAASLSSLECAGSVKDFNLQSCLPISR